MLSSVVIGENVEKIERAAFARCSKLSSIIIPDKVTSIGFYCFAECKNLSSVTIGNSVKEIGGYAFSKCENVESISIPDNVVHIKERAFQYCKNLKAIYVGAGIHMIDQYAFFPCANLTDVYCYSVNPPIIGQHAFSRLDATLDVAVTSLEIYKSNGAWNQFGNIVALSEEETSINCIPLGQRKNTMFYSIGGVPISHPQKGVNIVHFPDGSIKKIMKW